MVPNMGEQNVKWLPQPCFFGGQKRAEMLCHPCILGDPQSQVRRAKSEVVPNKRVQNQKWLPHHYLLGGAKEGGNAMLPLHSRRSPTPSAGSKIRSGPPQRGTKSEVAASPLPSQGSQKRAEMLRHPCILRDPQRQARGAKSEVACLTPAFWVAQKRAEMLRHPYILGDPQR